ncbi:hypothetical protein VTJ04DRAFT_2958 [Mycothermus thermophilus]|uniref:uncharacterized protein n=1 Tax=Humicola insolens TaxID=85995 RepID=UPI003742D734
MVTSHDGSGLVLVSDVHLKQPEHLRGSFRHGTAWAHPGRMMHMALVFLFSEKGKSKKAKSVLLSGISHTQGNPNEGNICSLCFGINGHHRWSGVCQGRRSGRHFDDDLLQTLIFSALNTFHPSRVFLPAL